MKGRSPDGREDFDGTWLAIGVGVRTAIGVATDHLAIGVAVGAAIGVALAMLVNPRGRQLPTPD